MKPPRGGQTRPGQVAAARENQIMPHGGGRTPLGRCHLSEQRNVNPDSERANSGAQEWGERESVGGAGSGGAPSQRGEWWCKERWRTVAGERGFRVSLLSFVRNNEVRILIASEPDPVARKREKGRVVLQGEVEQYHKRTRGAGERGFRVSMLFYRQS
jgi:hypothetical protein